MLRGYSISKSLLIDLPQLPEPLLTFDLYNDFITVGKKIQHLTERRQTEDHDEMVEAIIQSLKELLDKLPPYRYYTLQHMMIHLHRYTADTAFAQMYLFTLDDLCF